jgi:5S rRNA maturation endonuclease (ribonuclease M5)
MSAPQMFPHYSGAGNSRAFAGSAFDLDGMVRALRGHKTGRGRAMVRCPGHDDRTPSLSITERDGKLLVKCFAGCDQTAVVQALKDLGVWPTSERREHPPEWGRIVRTYDYTDENGELLYQICRFEPKSFRPRRLDGVGGWRWGYGDVRRVLYRLRDVIGNPIVFIVEGEKDVETLREYSFVATTNSGGANSWRDEFNEFFRGREVIIIPDADEPGVRRAGQIARGLLGIAARVSILELEGAKDVSEWFEKGHAEVELIALLEGANAS